MLFYSFSNAVVQTFHFNLWKCNYDGEDIGICDLYEEVSMNNWQTWIKAIMPGMGCFVCFVF